MRTLSEFQELFDIEVATEAVEVKPPRDSKEFPLPYKTKVLEAHPQLPAKMQGLLDDFFGWNISFSPNTRRLERSAYLELREPLKLGDDVIHSVQAKGIGARSSDGNTLVRPSNFFYRAPTFVVEGVAQADGRIYVGLPCPPPFGGLTLDDAKRESQAMIALHANGVLVPIPLLTVSCGIHWQGETVVGLAIGQVTPTNDRLDYMTFRMQGDEDYQATMGIRSATDFLKWKNRTSFLTGESLGKIHQAGYMDVHPHLGNYSYDFDSDRLVTHDLEATWSIQDKPEHQIGLRLLQDFMLGLADHIMFVMELKRKAEGKLDLNSVQSIIFGYIDGYFSMGEENTTSKAFFKEIKPALIKQLEKLPLNSEADMRSLKERVNIIALEVSFYLYTYSFLGRKHPIHQKTYQDFKREWDLYKKRATVLIENLQMQRPNGPRLLEIISSPHFKRGQLDAFTRRVNEAIS